MSLFIDFDVSLPKPGSFSWTPLSQALPLQLQKDKWEKMTAEDR